MQLSECVEHTGCKLPNGYGKVGRDGKTWLAHRWAWAQANGPIPDGLHVCHSCDNRLCVNPKHLFLGTREDNMQDMISKGRARFVGFLSPNFRPPEPREGERNGMAKLSASQAAEIRKATGPAKYIAPLYGVSIATVQRIRSGTNWKS